MDNTGIKQHLSSSTTWWQTEWRRIYLYRWRESLLSALKAKGSLKSKRKNAVVRSFISFLFLSLNRPLGWPNRWWKRRPETNLLIYILPIGVNIWVGRGESFYKLVGSVSRFSLIRNKQDVWLSFSNNKGKDNIYLW